MRSCEMAIGVIVFTPALADWMPWDHPYMVLIHPTASHYIPLSKLPLLC
jgi:hypothetical protein